MIGRSLVHLLRHRVGLDRADTQTTAREREVLQRHAAGRRRLVEVGVYEGVTTGLLASVMAPDGELFAVDPFLAGRLGICWHKWIARAEVSRAGGARRVQWVEAFSQGAARRISGAVDFVFLDGDHSLGAITGDWAEWSGRIVSHGIIALHDTIPPAHNPAVADLGSCRFFASHICADPRFELVEQVDSLSVLRRRP